MTIRFGTSGWRAVIADEFAFNGVRQVTKAICAHFVTPDVSNNTMIIEHDSRFVGEQFSDLVDRVAKLRDLPVYETPVGFKYIGELINEDKIILGGEESAGLSIKGHYPEKDGILACLLAAEAVAARGASLTEQLDALYERTGRLTAQEMQSLQDRLKENPSEIGGRRIAQNKSN